MSKPQFVLVVGGARSGKSGLAEELAERSGRAVTYVATAGAPRDAEMLARIDAHRSRRPAHWRTVEAPVEIAPLIAGEGVVLLDCLTLWLTNLVLGELDVSAHVAALSAALAARAGPVIAVSNEVGEGIVPATPLGRSFRDRQGTLNQTMARQATTVVKMVAGCPLVVKPAPPMRLDL